jgi:hypothetical protein
MSPDTIMHIGDIFLNIAIYLEGYYILRTKDLPFIQFVIYGLFTISGIFWFIWGVVTPNTSQIISGFSALTVQFSILFVISRRYIKEKEVSYQSIAILIKNLLQNIKRFFSFLVKSSNDYQ